MHLSPNRRVVAKPEFEISSAGPELRLACKSHESGTQRIRTGPAPALRAATGDRELSQFSKLGG